MSERFKVFITKYALTQGIEEVLVESTHTPTMVSRVSGQGNFSEYYHGEGRDWHRTRPRAIARANEMLQRKIASLKKQIAKFEKLKFT